MQIGGEIWKIKKNKCGEREKLNDTAICKGNKLMAIHFGKLEWCAVAINANFKDNEREKGAVLRDMTSSWIQYLCT